MSNQAKFLISLLFIAIIILCAGLTRFYFDVTKNTGNIDDGEKIDALVKTYENGMQVFESAGGYYGLLDAEGTVIIEPEWMEILMVTENMALVSSRVQDKVLIGGVDFEENVVLPFVFRSMERITDDYYIATAAEDESCIIYNNSFEPVFSSSWDDAEYDNGMLLLEKDNCLFSYYIAEEEPIFRKAQLSCMIRDLELEWNISNRIYLSELTVDELADRVFLSKYHFMRLFKAQTGSTVYAYVRQKRLMNASRLIREGVPAQKAAAESGFGDYSAFHRAFKESFGTSPGKLKK